MEDYLVRSLAKEAGLRGMACMTTNLVKELARRHGTAPTATVALGRALTGGVLLGSLLKMRQRLALKLEGNGPLHKLVVEADSNGQVRGYAAVPDVDLPQKLGEFNVPAALGRQGTLTVVRDLRLKELAEGVVPLVSGEIDEDLTYYLNQSEQAASLVKIGVYADETGEVEVAGGLLIQSMPPYNPELVQELAERLEEMPPVSQLLRSGKTAEDLLLLLFGSIPYRVLERRPVQFKCSCSRERTRAALATLGAEELESLLETEGQAVVDCHFCHEQYVFGREALEELIEELNAGGNSEEL
jgi:molecular chaperone Hsp33